MKLISTRGSWEGSEAPGHLRSAVLGGLAPDGGLYLPAAIPALSPEEFERLRDVVGFREVARIAAHRLLGNSLSADVIDWCVESGLDFEVPIVQLDERTWVMEVFRGPTGSFKDVGARFLAHLLSHFRGPGAERIVVLVATSGDTGGAVARAVEGLPGVQAMVLYPKGRISSTQLHHITTRSMAAQRQADGGSAPSDHVFPGVVPVAVQGSFDDCQHMVKTILGEGSPVPGMAVTSANSVNLGRLLPQSFFHVHGSVHTPGQGELLVSVPSANLGNLTSAIIAQRMGAPLHRLVGATNANAALPHFLETGELPGGESRATLSNAMDVARPSNLERLLSLEGGDRAALSRRVLATTHSDEETLQAMRHIHETHGYLADPHTAVGWLGLKTAEARGDRTPRRLVVSTADPAKFPETVRRATGVNPTVRSAWLAELGAGAERIPAVELPPTPDALRELIREIPPGD
ncbi:MAG: pyridoxal-phosphate dependent enzyme [Gemmatimonadota bacterium]